MLRLHPKAICKFLREHTRDCRKIHAGFLENVPGLQNARCAAAPFGVSPPVFSKDRFTVVRFQGSADLALELPEVLLSPGA